MTVMVIKITFTLHAFPFIICFSTGHTRTYKIESFEQIWPSNLKPETKLERNPEWREL